LAMAAVQLRSALLWHRPRTARRTSICSPMRSTVSASAAPWQTQCTTALYPCLHHLTRAYLLLAARCFDTARIFHPRRQLFLDASLFFVGLSDAFDFVSLKRIPVAYATLVRALISYLCKQVLTSPASRPAASRPRRPWPV
jgi:hypothetical protein